MVAAKTTTAVAKPRAVGSQIQVTTVQELNALADVLYKGGLCPAGIDNPNKVAAVIMAGMEVGLAPTQAIGSIMLTNGRLSIYGDGAMALVRASGLLESIEEHVEGEGDDRKGVCKVKRKGEPERVYEFSKADANRAGLIERAKGKGPWVTFLDRMLIMRPRGFAFRDIFPDVLRGLVFWEEAQDIGDAVTVEAKVTPAAGQSQQATPAALPAAAAPTVTATPEEITTVVVKPTDDQLKEIAGIRASYFASRSLSNADEQAAAWKEMLAPYGVASAKEFTPDAAAKFISVEGPKHDPFGHPPAKSSAA